MTDSMPPGPHHPPPPPGPPHRPPPPRGPSFFRMLASLLFLLFFAAVLIGFGFILGILLLGGSGGSSLTEKHHSGKAGSHNKIAVVKIEGVLLEGRMGYAEKQIEQAMLDKQVKAVVVRIDSPGGSITASDDLYEQLQKLRDGDTARSSDPRPLVVSMGSIAASGGYYIAMAARADDKGKYRAILAESTTLTGSIGVYAALPNVYEGGQKIGVRMDVIKAGDEKANGSPFSKELTERDKDLWQNMIDHAYLRFIDVVEHGRPALAGKLQEDITITESLPVRSGDKKKHDYALQRYRADGGIFTTAQAKEFGLIDGEGNLEAAITEAAKAANLSEYNVVQYERPPTLMGALLGIKAPQAPLQVDADHLASAATPRIWYLAPQSEWAGILAAAGKE